MPRWSFRAAVLAAIAAIAATAVILAACKTEPRPADRGPSAPPRPATPARKAGAGAASPCDSVPPRPARHPAAARIVAIGDLHGDVEAARRALALAGAIDDRGHWSGGDLVVVQTGDILDRGDHEQAILDLFERLAGEARAAGGAVHVLLGNHETMNASGDFRYVTPGGLADFQDVAGLDLERAGLAGLAPAWRARAAALLPGGPYARVLAGYDTVVIVGDTVFAHGGVLPQWADHGIDRLNRALRCWLAGHTPPPSLLQAPDNPLWSRHYSVPPERCDLLERTLETLDAARMVVAHTPQLGGITPACGNKAWRIDTGMAAHYGGPTQVLEIRGADVRVLAAP